MPVPHSQLVTVTVDPAKSLNFPREAFGSFSPLFSSEILILIPSSTTHADYWNIIVFNPATILHARVFVGFGFFGRTGEGQQLHFLSDPHS